MSSPLDISSALEHLQLVTLRHWLQYFNAASTAILFYDYFTTLPREVSLVWPARWTYMKLLYLMTRYLPFIDVALRIYDRVQQDLSAERCARIFSTSTWLFYIGTALPEIILTLRTWAVWDRDWRFSIGLPIFFALCWFPNIGVIIYFLNSLEFMPLGELVLLGCLPVKGSHITFICWILLLIYEAGVFCLMLIQGIKCYRCGGSSDLFFVVFRDGLLYYLFLFAFSLANMVVVSVVPPDMQSMLVLAERCVHPIIACRVILDIRAQVLHTTHPSWLDTRIPKSPSLAFAHISTTSVNADVIEIDMADMR